MAEPIESLRANPIKRIGNTAIAGFDTVDFDAFYREELPRRLKEGLNEKIAWDVAGLRPLSIGLPDGRAYSYVAAGERVEIVSGIADDAETVLEIDESAWQDYVNEFRTRFSLLYSGVVKFVRGSFDTWERWEPAIRCMYSGRSILETPNPEKEAQPCATTWSFATER